MTKQNGEAYAFFNIPASKEDIEKMLPMITEEVEAHGKLELMLCSVPEFLQNPDSDKDLIEFVKVNEISSTYPEKYRHLEATAQSVQMRDLQYLLGARYEQHSNVETAEYLNYIVNNLQRILNEGEILTVAVVGRDDNDEYDFWFDD